MPKNNKQSPIIPMVAFKPAELRIGTDWLIVYYAKDPQSDKLVRFRNRVPKMSNKKERLRFAQKMIDTLNEQLYSGWSPYMGNLTEVKTIDYCFDYYLKTLSKELSDGVKRKSTYNNYKYFITAFTEYLSIYQKNVKFISDISTLICDHFLDRIYIEKEKSARTYNFYLMCMRTFFNFCLSKGFIKESPVKNTKTKSIKEKTRVVLNEKEKAKLALLKEENFHFYVFCMTTYYCFIRPNELKKLKVENVNIEKNYITIPSSISKNRKTENVTIPNIFIEELKEHIGKASKDLFLFGKKFVPGKQAVTNLFYHWENVRKKYGFRKEVQFYSLKDTGITDMLNAGVPAIKVRDQARHSDLKITEIYTARNNSADETVKNIHY
ncbi:site-specific integrase [uncultured Capnocytophaga sp.]|uniref:tyrosine-type recombinase/integrase n=1 Tax=uncultured Capnocytophaga sp. TaxID=159273 RepID=UPI0026389597|nr:site-specific integrase [uncultured Capnocytophaga sp.]